MNMVYFRFITCDGFYRAVAEAIVQGDSVGAKCAMIMHLTYNRQMLVKMMQERKAGNKTDDNKE